MKGIDWDAKCHWFDNDANESVCGTLGWAGNRMEDVRPIHPAIHISVHKVCKVCSRMIAGERQQ